MLPYMINNGSFGYNQPMAYGGNMYIDTSPQNMINVGSYNYNTTSFSPTNNTSGFVFKPLPTNIQPAVQDYYNPYPMYNNNMNSYAINYMNQNNMYRYNGYSPFISMQQRETMIQNTIALQKKKYEIAMVAIGKEYDEEKADEIFNPNNQVNIKSDKQIEEDKEWDMVQKYYNAFQYPQYNPNDPYKHLANFIQLQLYNYHQAFDNHSLCEFLEEDFPRLQLEFWIAENIKKNGLRDLSTTYDSKEYNDLLSMHKSSNPYINELMDDSRYDSNKDDTELGIKEMFERRKRLLEGKLPTYISSPEVQEQRRLFTQTLIDQIMKKKGSVPDVPT